LYKEICFKFRKRGTELEIRIEALGGMEGGIPRRDREIER